MLRDRQNRCLSQFKSISHISLGSAEAAAASFHIHRAWPLSTWSCCALRVKVAVKLRMMSGDSTDRRLASSPSSSSTWVLINALKTKRPPSRFAPKRNALTPLPSPPRSPPFLTFCGTGHNRAWPNSIGAIFHRFPGAFKLEPRESS